MTATWKLDELSATALLKLSGGTRLTRIACVAGPMKARALPNSTSTANTGHTVVSPTSVKASKVSPHSSCAASAMAIRLRRS